MIKITLSIISVVALLTSCSDNLQVDVMENPETELAHTKVSAFLSPDQICSDVTVKAEDGKEVKGTRDCAKAEKVCTKVGDIHCVMEDAKVYGIHDDKLTAENTRQGIPFGNKVGKATSDHPVCSADGQKDCVVKDDVTAVDTATIAAKTISGQTVAGIAGSYDPGYPNKNQVLTTDTVAGEQGTLALCSRPGQSNCVATATHRAVATSKLVPANIRSNFSIGGVAGSYDGAFANCTTNNTKDCLATNTIVAVQTGFVNAAKVRQAIRLGDALGTLQESPGQCNGTSKTACVTNSRFPAADYRRITAANIKTNVVIPSLTANITGAYPSATHPLMDDRSGTKNLSATNFNASMASADSFEYWDSAGVRHTNQGDGALVAANLATTATIFGVTGAVKARPVLCSDAKTEDCVTSASHPSFIKSRLTAGNIKKSSEVNWNGSTITGAFPSADHPLAGSTGATQLTGTTFNTQVANGGVGFEYWDSTGAYKTGKGSATLIGANIVKDVNIFGVMGTADIRPANCSDRLGINCVTTSSFPSYDPSVLTAAKIRNGVKVGQVTGTFPSATNRLTGSSPVADLTKTDFNARITVTQPFEFWDHEGTRYQLAGNGLLSANHIQKDVQVFGQTGTLEKRGDECHGTNQNGCVATSTYPSYLKSALEPKVVKSGETVMGVAGAYPSATNKLEDQDSAVADLGDQADLYTKLSSASTFEFWDSNGVRYTASGDADLIPGNISNGVDIFGVVGNMTPSPGICTGEGLTNCVATARYQPYDTTTLTPGVLKKDVSLGGITGDYPSENFPLANATATTDLQGSTAFGPAVTTAGTVEYFTPTGARVTQTVVKVEANTIRNGVNLFGVEGTADAARPLCSAARISNCQTSSNFPAYQDGLIKAAELKKGVEIGGVSGIYPSSSAPLQNSTAGTPDLDHATFNAKVKNNAEFEYFDSAGTRYVERGDADITVPNIRTGVSIFGTTGDINDGTASPIAANNLRAGVTAGSTAGTVKISCANTARGGNPADITTPDYNAGTVFPQDEIYGPHKSCKQGTFVDQRKGNSDCTSSSHSCIFKDMISGMLWHSTQTDTDGKGIDRNFSQADVFCKGLHPANTWRVPSHKELVTAYVNGLRQANLVNKELFPWMSHMWTSTHYSHLTNATFKDKVKVIFPRDFLHEAKTNTESAGMRALCVRGPI